MLKFINATKEEIENGKKYILNCANPKNLKFHCEEHNETTGEIMSLIYIGKQKNINGNWDSYEFSVDKDDTNLISVWERKGIDSFNSPWFLIKEFNI